MKTLKTERPRRTREIDEYITPTLSRGGYQWEAYQKIRVSGRRQIMSDILVS